MYERNEKHYMHKISRMEKVIPSFQYEPLVFTPKPKTSNEGEKKGNFDGVRPSGTRTKKEKLANLRGGKVSSQGGLALLENMWLDHCANHSFCSGSTIVGFQYAQWFRVVVGLQWDKETTELTIGWFG